MKKQKNTLFLIFTLICVLLCVSACSGDEQEANPTSNVVFHTPANGTATSVPSDGTQSPSAESASAPIVTETPIATPTLEPTKIPTPLPTAVPTATPAPSTEDFKLSVDYAENTSDKATYTNRAPLKQVSFTVTDPQNTRGLSTERVGHWFGKDDTQPKKFQQQYEAKGWSALTIDTKSTDKVIYLTFDCGYENGNTGRILTTLKEKNCPAAFFVTLDFAKDEPGLVSRMIEDGHIVGNHSSSHPDFTKISREKVAREVQKLDNYLRVNFGYSSRYFRYPMGAYSDNTMELLTSLGYRSIFWSYAYEDYNEGSFPGKDLAFKYVTERLHEGEVLLLHAISPGNADALGDIIDDVRAQGYEFRSLDQYFNH